MMSAALEWDSMQNLTIGYCTFDLNLPRDFENWEFTVRAHWDIVGLVKKVRSPTWSMFWGWLLTEMWLVTGWQFDLSVSHVLSNLDVRKFCVTSFVILFRVTSFYSVWFVRKSVVKKRHRHLSFFSCFHILPKQTQWHDALVARSSSQTDPQSFPHPLNAVVAPSSSSAASVKALQRGGGGRKGMQSLPLSQSPPHDQQHHQHRRA